MIEVCAHGEFLASQIAAHPLLLDELLDERLFEEPADPAALASDLERRMQDVALEEPERQVETLREYQRAAVFRIAVADLSGRLPVTQVSDRLTQLAEIIIDQSMRLAGQQMTAQFGTPRCGPERRVVRVCAVGYGKLGGRELGYGSDLDLVFLHDSAGEAQETDGRPPLDNGHYFVRLAQRMLHLLTLHSAAGRLYEVDVRLRPSGKGGLLITQIDAFADYQRKEAWTWEHQSLLHARAVAGDAALRARFEDVRLATLTAHVRRKRLAADVRAMRARMHRQHPPAASGVFHLKRDAGGITDIEFLAQYWALSFAEKYPPVVLFSDTIRQLESVASADLVPQATVDLLTAAYRSYREVLHHRSLERAEPTVPRARFDAERETVMRIWRQTFG
jgi:glutamate-ammonia-ligase adenylyltransferase